MTRTPTVESVREALTGLMKIGPSLLLTLWYALHEERLLHTPVPVCSSREYASLCAEFGVTEAPAHDRPFFALTANLFWRVEARGFFPGGDSGAGKLLVLGRLHQQRIDSSGTRKREAHRAGCWARILHKAAPTPSQPRKKGGGKGRDGPTAPLRAGESGSASL